MSDPAPDDAGRPERQPSFADRALDLFVFAPAGAVLSALEDVPGMAARGRARFEQEVRNAHLIGRFAVGEGQRRLKRGIERLGSATPGGPPPAEPPPAAGPRVEAPAPSPAPPSPATPPAEPAGGPPGSALGAVPTKEGGSPAGSGDDEAAVAADRAIPGYDSLSASQVVRRLDGLGPRELAAVFRHESATRGRRTILHRAQQLLGPSDQRPPAGT